MLQFYNISFFMKIHGLAAVSVPIVRAVFIAVTSYAFLLLVCLAVLGYCAFQLRADSRIASDRALARLGSIIIVVLSSWGLVGLLKDAFAVPRPFEALPGVSTLIDMPSGWSFPSGHTTMAFALATTVLLLHHKHRPKREVWFIVLLYVVAIFVGFSRVYVGVHYPLDVLAGAVLGILAPFAITLSMRALRPHIIALRGKKG